MKSGKTIEMIDKVRVAVESSNQHIFILCYDHKAADQYFRLFFNEKWPKETVFSFHNHTMFFSNGSIIEFGYKPFDIEKYKASLFTQIIETIEIEPPIELSSLIWEHLKSRLRPKL